jgi:hypothetical protein
MPEVGSQMSEIRNQESESKDRSAEFGPQSSVLRKINQGVAIGR